MGGLPFDRRANIFLSACALAAIVLFWLCLLNLDGPSSIKGMKLQKYLKVALDPVLSINVDFMCKIEFISKLGLQVRAISVFGSFNNWKCPAHDRL